jgi:hypothetical protein
MKKFVFTLFFLPSIAFSFDATVKGFIAVDALNFQKIGSHTATDIGIGALDLKIFAEQDKMSAALKLAIKSNLNVPGNLFEQAYASYRGVPDWKFSFGKGQVNFQNLHWGVALNSYLDGGSILSTENSWRKVYNKAFLSVAYGKRDMGYLDTFTLYGDSGDINTYDTTPSKYVKGDGGSVVGYTLNSSPTFTLEKQFGLANKFEIYKIDQWVFNASQIYFKNKYQPNFSYALDFGAMRESNLLELWVDVLYGYTSKAPFESYSTFAKNEYFIQLGTEYHLNEIWSIKGNSEYLHVKDQSHLYPASFSEGGVTYTNSTDNKAKSGQTVISTSYKLDIGVQYRLAKTAFLTLGAVYEKKLAEKDGVKGLSAIPGVNNPNTEGYELGSFIAFWF